MLYLLNWRLWVAIAALVLYPTLYLKGQHDGSKQVRIEWDASVSRANSEARHLEQQRQRRVDDVARIAAAREDALRRSAVLARADASSLRDTLSAVERASADSLSAANEALRVTSGLFGRCTSLYLGVAEAAQRADSESRELRAAWPQ